MRRRTRFSNGDSAGATHDGTFLSMDHAADIVILSPHLDDAVLSFGGTISREVARGRTVDVWTCFTDAPALEAIPTAQRPLGDYAARREEDRRALTVLERATGGSICANGYGVTPDHARITICSTRPPAWTGSTACRPARHCARIDSGPIEAVAPLGVGHHHDHVEVTLAFLLEMLSLRRFDRVHFYEIPTLTEALRRAHFVTRRRSWKPWASPRPGKPADWRIAVCSLVMLTRSSN